MANVDAEQGRLQSGRWAVSQAQSYVLIFLFDMFYLINYYNLAQGFFVLVRYPSFLLPKWLAEGQEGHFLHRRYTATGCPGQGPGDE